MKTEIERKFFVKTMPDLSGIKPQKYERYFLERGSGAKNRLENGAENRSENRPENGAKRATEIRISKVDDSYKYEVKREISALERTREKREITKEKFDRLKQGTHEAIIRDRYNIPSDHDSTHEIAIQIYHGRFEGLIRAEVEFETQEDAEAFVPLPWMGEEMTGLPIARDSKLPDLTEEEFGKYIRK